MAQKTPAFRKLARAFGLNIPVRTLPQVAQRQLDTRIDEVLAEHGVGIGSTVTVHGKELKIYGETANTKFDSFLVERVYDGMKYHIQKSSVALALVLPDLPD